MRACSAYHANRRGRAPRGAAAAPLQWQEYLSWAVNSFASLLGVPAETQIHTRTRYSEIGNIEAIAVMDADVISIETSRSNMELLGAFDRYEYPNQIGPGVYDIHSTNVPTEQQIVDIMSNAAERIPASAARPESARTTAASFFA